MAKNDNLGDFCKDIADAIKEKKGSQEPINAQSFSEEIRNLPSSSSPFAVDFGEEIATENPAFINVLQEDIDYYNEVQRKRAAGEVTDAELAKESEFRDKIVWWPKGMNGGFEVNYTRIPYKKLRRYVFPESRLSYYAFRYCFNIEEVEITAANENFNGGFLCDSNLKNVTIHGDISNANEMFKDCISLETVNIDASKINNANNMFVNNLCLLDIDLSFDSLENSSVNLFQRCRCRNLRINLPNVESLSGTFRECEVTDTLYLNIPKVTKATYSLFYNNSDYYSLGENVFISGLMVSMSLTFAGAKSISAESVKYILDHCQAREDGASYTLTLHETVKQNFLNKCTEGHEDYDAEYAASLVSATEKGLTLA